MPALSIHSLGLRGRIKDVKVDNDHNEKSPYWKDGLRHETVG